METSASTIYLSPVKREQLRQKQRKDRKEQMRSELPVLDKFQIRRYRLPLYQALVEELTEMGLLSSASFLHQLVEYHEKMRNEHGPDTPVWCRPRLIERNDVLTELSDVFKAAELAHTDSNIALEFDTLLTTGIRYAFGSQDWWWLGEQILYQCVRVSTDYSGDGSMREALSRYIMGKFLLENLVDPMHTTQVEYLGKCRKLSKGMKWSARNVLHCKQDTLFVESNKLLLQALLMEARETKKYDAFKAVALCRIARKRAIDSCDRAAEAEVLKLMGKCEMDCDESRGACESFYRSLVLNIKANNIKEICEIRILLALAYMKVENYKDALYQLETLHKFAEENGLPFYKGQAYRYLGEIYINKGQPDLATPILEEALVIFDELSDAYNRRRTRNLCAVSAGQEHIAKYIKLIINCGRPQPEGFSYLQKLLDWKDFRAPFWEEGDIEDYKIEYPEVEYGQIEHSLDLIEGLTHLHKESSTDLEESVEDDVESNEMDEDTGTLEEKYPEKEDESVKEEESPLPPSTDNFDFMRSSQDSKKSARKSEELGDIQDDKDVERKDEAENSTIDEDHEIEWEREEYGENEGEAKVFYFEEGEVWVEAHFGPDEYEDSEAEGAADYTEGEPEEIILGEQEDLLGELKEVLLDNHEDVFEGEAQDTEDALAKTDDSRTKIDNIEIASSGNFTNPKQPNEKILEDELPI